MTIPNASLIQTGLQKLYAAFADDKTERGTRTAVNHLSWLTGYLNFLYGVPVNVSVTDTTDASPTAFIASGGPGEGYTAGITASGDIFRNTGVGDFNDNALQTAKTAQVASDLAAGDVFVMSSGTAVVYLGNTSGITFDNVGERAQDFISIGS